MNGEILKKNWFYPALFVLSVLVFYPELLFVRAAPLVGDHWEQHYPWAAHLAAALKNGKLPFWTPLLGCGFPIAAESQIGVFYVPNLLLFGLLPLKTAYSWQMLFHFTAGGLGLYAYSRRLGLERPAAFLGAFLFVFGTGYGGAYYNVTSLKTLCWLPVMLALFEAYAADGRKRWLTLLAPAAGQTLVAGYMQVAALGLLIFGAAVLLRMIFFPDSQALYRRRPIFFVLMLGLALTAGLVLAFPQIFLTFQLAVRSNRSGLEEGYAYAGSLSPLALVTLILPHAQGLFRGNCLYNGMGMLFLAAAAFSDPQTRRLPAFRLWGMMAALSLVLAFGRWSPLYVGMIKLSHFYSFRTPAKFLIFFNFSTALLAAFGFQALLRAMREKNGAFLRIACRLFTRLLAGLLLLTAAGYLALTALRPFLTRIGEAGLRRFVYGQAGHPHGWDFYQQKLQDVFNAALELLSPFYPWTLWCLCLAVLYVAAVQILARRYSGKALLFFLGLLGADLYVFSYGDMRTDFATYASVSAISPWQQALTAEKEAGRTGRLYGFRRPEEFLPVLPGPNMLIGIPDIGVYSPLVLSRYFETAGLFGNVNDSNQAAIPDPAFVLDRLEFLDALDVSHILSTAELIHPRLVPVLSSPEKHRWLYRKEGPRARAWAVFSWEILPDWETLKSRLMAPHFNPVRKLLIERGEIHRTGIQVPPGSDHLEMGLVQRGADGDDFSNWEVEIPSPAFLVTSDLWFPGWKARVNGREVPVLAGDGLFRSVYLDGAGRYQVEFWYEPFSAGGNR